MNIMNLFQMISSGGNPNQLFQSFVSQNPKAAPAMQMIQDKSPDQLKNVFFNLCNARGIDPNMLTKQMGIDLTKY